MPIILSEHMYTRVIQCVYSKPSQIYINNSITMTRRNDNVLEDVVLGPDVYTGFTTNYWNSLQELMELTNIKYQL